MNDYAFQATTLARIGTTARWRRVQMDNFPHDLRNAHAADRLEEFAAASPRDVDPAIWTAIDIPDQQKLQRLLSASARKVGFSSYPTSLEDFLAEVASAMKGQR